MLQKFRWNGVKTGEVTKQNHKAEPLRRQKKHYFSGYRANLSSFVRILRDFSERMRRMWSKVINDGRNSIDGFTTVKRPSKMH